MIKVSLLGHGREREKTLLTLQKLGIMQLIDAKGVDLEPALPAEDVREISDLLLRVSHVVSTLKIAPMKQHWSQKLFGLETREKALVKRKEKKQLIKEALAYLKTHEAEILALEENHEAALEELEELKEYRKVIRLLEEHNIPITVLGETRNVRFTTGLLPAQNMEPLQAELQKELKGRFHLEVSQSDKKNAVIVITSLQEESAAVNFIVKKFGLTTFAFRRLPPSKKPREWVEKEIEAAEKTLDSTVKKIAKLQKHFDEAVFLREELELLKERFEAVHKLREAKSFFVLQGWVTATQLTLLRRTFRHLIIVEEEAEEGEEPPVSMSNPGFLKPFEMLTELYALPKYKDLDPTFIVAPLFIVYAGFMLTDFVYGLGLLLMGGVMYALFRKQDQGVTYMSINIALMGFFAMFFGVLTGSYLGDAPKYFFGLETAQLAIWKDPLADPLYFLIISLFVGLVHLNIGLILGLIEDIRKKAWKTMLSDRIIWWMLQLAVLFYVLGWMMGGHVMLGLTVLVVLIMQGPLGLLGMTGFMGDVISYSRLFALALSTAGIAMTVNLLADMLNQVPGVGIVLAALIFICGHLFSFLMNSLGSFVHSIRLQFVEFFGKFYEGGGDKFEPFREERVYTEVEE
jgi:V/A-type H+-transporting ATPase subunit I